MSFLQQILSIAEYLQGGGDDVATESPKQAATPGYPDEDYPNGLDIEWRITGKQGYVIVIKFTSFDIRNQYDFVYVGTYRDDVLHLYYFLCWQKRQYFR